MIVRTYDEKSGNWMESDFMLTAFDNQVVGAMFNYDGRDFIIYVTANDIEQMLDEMSDFHKTMLSLWTDDEN